MRRTGIEVPPSWCFKKEGPEGTKELKGRGSSGKLRLQGKRVPDQERIKGIDLGARSQGDTVPESCKNKEGGGLKKR